MSLPTRFGALIACALICACCSTRPSMASQPDQVAWRDLHSLSGLVEHLESWLDTHTDLPRRSAPPHIQLIGIGKATRLQAGARFSKSDQTRGLYDPVIETIYLVRPWNMRNLHDVSVLLHELVHHRQATAGHWYCPGAQELPAYRAQEAWLAAHGLRANINWIAVVLEAGCTPRDIHPD